MDAKFLKRSSVYRCLIWCLWLVMGVSPVAAQTNLFVPIEKILEQWRSLPLSNVVQAATAGELTAQHYLGYYYTEGAGGVTNYAEGLKWYRLAAERGFPNALNNLGVAYLKGIGVGRDEATAIQWFEQAAQKGFPKALGNLSSLMRDAKYSQNKYGYLRGLLEEAAYRGDPEAQIALGYFLKNPPSAVTVETDGAVYWYKKALAGGRAEACYYIGEALIANSDPRTRELAFLWYQKGAELGDQSSMAAVSWALLGGRGVKQDGEKGLKIGLDVAGKGHKGMMYMLGTYYAHEDIKGTSPIPRDRAQAMKWYRKAAELGYGRAMVRLGSHLMEETNPEMQKEGLKWLHQAETQGLTEATQEIAAWTIRRPGSIQDWGKIEELAMSNYDIPLEALVKRHRDGQGVPVDILCAVLWKLKLNTLGSHDLWEDVPGVDDGGKLLAAASMRDQEFGRLYLNLVKAMRNRETAFFQNAAKAYENGDGRPKNLVLSTIFYELVSKNGDLEVREKLSSLRAGLETWQAQTVSEWMVSLGRMERSLKGE